MTKARLVEIKEALVAENVENSVLGDHFADGFQAGVGAMSQALEREIGKAVEYPSALENAMWAAVCRHVSQGVEYPSDGTQEEIHQSPCEDAAQRNG